MYRIHIVGISPRTGTTLLAECMRVSFEIGRAEAHEVSLNTLHWCTSVYLTKKPDDIRYVGMRLAVDPRLTVICMVRDPRDTIMSRHGKKPDDYFANLGRWKEHNAYVRRYRDHPRFVTVRYEDLVADPDGVQALILRRIRYLNPIRAFSAFHAGTAVSREAELALRGVRPIDGGSIAQWRHDLPRLANQLAQFGPIDEELVEHGYETDASWREEFVELAGLDGRDGHAAAALKKIRSDALVDRIKRPVAAGICWVCSLLGIPVG